MASLGTLTIGLNAGPLSAALAAVEAHAAAITPALAHLRRDATNAAASNLAAKLERTTEALLEAVAGSVVVSDHEPSMGQAQMATCFNEWMRRFIEEPARFEREFETVTAFMADEAGGREPTYGETSAAYMAQLAAEADDPDAVACGACGKPLQEGDTVRDYDDIGTAHADCDEPRRAFPDNRMPVDPEEFTGEGPPPEFATVYAFEGVA